MYKTYQTMNILDCLPSYTIITFLEHCPPKTFVRFISCNKQAYSLGKHMIEKKMTESLRKVVHPPCWHGSCSMPNPKIEDHCKSYTYVYNILPNGNRHGLQTIYYPPFRILSSTNFKNGMVCTKSMSLEKKLKMIMQIH